MEEQQLAFLDSTVAFGLCCCRIIGQQSSFYLIFVGDMDDGQVQVATSKLQVRSSGKPVRTPRRLHSSPLVEHRAALEKQKYYLFSRILPIFICFHKLAVIFPSPYLRVPARTNLLSKSPWVTLVSIPLTVSQCYPQYIYTLCNQKVIKFYTASHIVGSKGHRRSQRF